MTNKEKYLKEGVSAEKFANELATYLQKQDKTIGFQYYNICQFLMKPITPTLTEDEKVILRNIGKNFNIIGREENVGLKLKKEEHSTYYCMDMFSDLFQFIKERRRIRDSRTFERRVRIKMYFFIAIADFWLAFISMMWDLKIASCLFLVFGLLNLFVGCL